VHCRLVRTGVLQRLEPDAHHVLAGQPFFVFGSAQANHCTALCADQILGGDADRPAQACGLCHDLVQRVNCLRSANARDRFHLFPTLEKLHAEWCVSQPQ
jgi:hypothetical protein